MKGCTLQEWINVGRRLFGIDMQNLKVICPNCGHVTKINMEKFMKTSRLREMKWKPGPPAIIYNRKRIEYELKHLTLNLDENGEII